MSASIADLRAELDRVRALEADWKSRGSPEPEGAGVRAKVAAAEALLGNAIANAPADPDAPGDMLPPDQDPWASTDANAPSPVAVAHGNKVAAKRSQQKPPRPHASSRDVLNKETDARFWAQTHYKVGQKLDPNSAADRAYVKTWLDTFHKVEAEDQTGHLVTTYDHPDVVANLEAAKAAREAAEAHYEQAHDPWADKATVDQRVKDAQAANAASKDAANAAAAYQPPTVSPQVVQTSVDDANRALGQPPTPNYVPGKGHPAWSQPGAHPTHPELAMPSAQTEPVAATPADKLGVANTTDAAARAADAHAREETQASGGGLPRFPDKAPESKGMSTTVKLGLAALGVAVLGGLSYGVYQLQGGSGRPSRSRPSRPRARKSRVRAPGPNWAPPTMPGRPGSMP